MNATVWILIVAMRVHSGGNIEFQEFSDKDACVNALRVTLSLGDRESWNAPSATCVPKSTTATKEGRSNG